ncbi:c-type cytochrome [Lewinella cohaerens]|uniref:c-type cytochrome n=1 Tax=Lewinella cohaerens TaxID=70995 RepID=UPI00037EF347|nr:cytochrome c [Lewinella cohaerens]
MLRHFSTIATLCWLLLTGLFFLLCFSEWQRPNSSQIFYCGTVSPIEKWANDPKYKDLELGKSIFRNNCAACHANDMKTNLTGPALGEIREHWRDHGGDTALYAWIRNSQEMIASGENQRAQKLWEEWGPTIMNSFEKLTDEEIDAVIGYIEMRYGGIYSNNISS